MNYTTTVDEIRTAVIKLIKELKVKSPVTDKIKNEMSKASLNDTIPPYQIFN